MRTVIGSVVFAGVLACAAAQAQNETARAPVDDGGFYRMDFSLKDLENGKVVTTRHYQMIMRTDDNSTSSIRSGGRIPIRNENNFSYYEIGVNIDVRHLRRIKEGLTLDIVAEVTGDVDTGEGQARPMSPPLIRQAKWNSTVVIPVQKATPVFSSDDPTARRQLQLEVTATPVR